jgi:hypothetical protein
MYGYEGEQTRYQNYPHREPGGHSDSELKTAEAGVGLGFCKDVPPRKMWFHRKGDFCGVVVLTLPT